ncbi:MAG: hypothetical protein ACK5QW_02045 [Cyanobacteriota bacterium]|jgi:hypothetical protein
MPSGLRVTRIDKIPSAGLLAFYVNGIPLAGLPHRAALELTVESGELLLELIGTGSVPVFQLLDIAPGSTARVQIGRRWSMGVRDPSHYLHVDRPISGLPDRSLHPLNLSAHTALEWLQEKRSLGEGMTQVQLTYLGRHRSLPNPAQPCASPSIPSLAELGAFAALGLGPDAEEAEVREAFRLLTSIHAPPPGEPSPTLTRLDEAFRVAMDAVARRVRPGVTEVGR